MAAELLEEVNLQSQDTNRSKRNADGFVFFFQLVSPFYYSESNGELQNVTVVQEMTDSIRKLEVISSFGICDKKYTMAKD